MKVAINYDIPAERLANLFCTAIESGDPVTTASRGGWCDGIYYKSKRHKPPANLEWWYADNDAWFGSDDFQVEIVEVDETTGRKTSYIVRQAEVKKGLEVMSHKFPKLFQWIISDNIDATCADIFLQCICFGEEKYA